jgi:transglutaminase-like putative cysteine protease
MAPVRRRSFVVAGAALAAAFALGAGGGVVSAADSAEAGAAKSAATAPPLSETTYDVVHSFEVTDLPEGAKQVRVWFWMPEDRPEQKVLDFRVASAPSTWKVTRDPGYGRSWLYAEAGASKDAPVKLVTEFSLRRREVRGLADAAKARPVEESHRRTFAKELRLDEVHMEVTPALQKVADELCGAETNPVLQARKLFDYVIQKSDHYSKFGPKPKGQCLGDAMECMGGTGDCCTDQHALFIALARARGIPCRLMFGSRLKPDNEGKDHDPGYRCWPNFFAPGIGWVPMDISSADTAKDAPERWFGGLDDRRVEWAEGRDFDLEPRSAVRPDLINRGGWVEVDGKPHASFTRTVKFTTRK